jgi:hypothetical protein
MNFIDEFFCVYWEFEMENVEILFHGLVNEKPTTDLPPFYVGDGVDRLWEFIRENRGAIVSTCQPPGFGKTYAFNSLALDKFGMSVCPLRCMSNQDYLIGHINKVLQETDVLEKVGDLYKKGFYEEALKVTTILSDFVFCLAKAVIGQSCIFSCI